MYKLISELPLPAEQIDKAMFERISGSEYEYCEMDTVEKRFLYGLIRFFKPKNILEIGVSSGGGSGLILAAIEDMDDTTLTSVDIAQNAYAFPSEPVGFVALRKHSDNKKWNLVSGKDPSEVIESFNKKFDFAIIDTAHVHPIETLNFLSVLPFLEDGAIVVLHDISLFLSQSIYRDMKGYPMISLATRYLLNSVAAEKVEPEPYKTDLDTQLVNIGAFQISNDTRKYIDGVFGSLFVPWALIPDIEVLNSIGSIVKKHYSEKHLEMFENSVRVNNYVQCKELKNVQDLPTILERYKNKYILFGQRDARKYLQTISGAGYGDPIEIWDNSDVTVNCDLRIAVTKPHFDVSDNVAIIFTVRSERTYRNVVRAWPQEFRERSFFFKKLSY